MCRKISISKKLGRGTLSIVRTSETGMSQTQQKKAFSAKSECNDVNFGWLQNSNSDIQLSNFTWFDSTS